MFFLIIEVQDEGEEERDHGEVNAQFQHLSLEQKVEVAVSAAVKHPVLHLQLVDNRLEHLFENGVCFRLGIKPAPVYLLDVDVFIDWQLG